MQPENIPGLKHTRLASGEVAGRVGSTACGRFLGTWIGSEQPCGPVVPWFQIVKLQEAKDKSFNRFPNRIP